MFVKNCCYSSLYNMVFSLFIKYFHSDVVICPHAPEQKSIVPSEIYHYLRIFLYHLPFIQAQY